jgi:hypothetical protein
MMVFRGEKELKRKLFIKVLKDLLKKFKKILLKK